MAKQPSNALIKIPDIIGLPPWNLEPRTNAIMLNTMPTAEIHPSVPSFQEGIDLFRLGNGWDSYKKLLNSHGFDVETGVQSIKVAFLADSFPTDTFQNEYGENFLQKMTDIASQGAADISQFLGARSATAGLRKVQERLKAKGGMAAGIGTGMEMVGGAARGVMEALQGMSGGKGIARGINLVDRLAAGARIDFPQVWKTSSFTPSYTMTIRLYNPNPQSDIATDKYIIGPIAALMLLGTPISDDGATYNWPFLHKVRATGIYDLDPAYIGGITIIKGGDQQSIAYNQRLGMVDVRIDFGSLYNTMVASNSANPARPTLKKYLNVMRGARTIYDSSGEGKLNETQVADTTKTPATATEASTGTATSRVDPDKKEIADSFPPNPMEEEE
jgi:hypothetical protein